MLVLLIFIDRAGFHFLNLYLTNQLMSSSIMTSSFVWNQILLLCPFHKVLVSWVKMSWGFEKEINSNWESPCITEKGLRIKPWRKRTWFISLVPENKAKDKSRPFIGEERVGVLLSRDNVRVTGHVRSWAGLRTRCVCIKKRSPEIKWTSPSLSFNNMYTMLRLSRPHVSYINNRVIVLKPINDSTG